MTRTALISRNAKALRLDIGTKYKDVTFANYKAGNDRHKDKRIAARDRVQGVAKKCHKFMDGRYGLVLYGSVGTGKDHLAVCLLKVLVNAGYSARWP